MGLKSTVRALALRLDESAFAASPRQRLMLRILSTMPEYGGAKRLDLWEKHFQDAEEGASGADDASDIKSAPLEQMIVEVFELGRTCLYSAYVERSVREAYADVAALFQANGVRLPEDPELSAW